MRLRHLAQDLHDQLLLRRLQQRERGRQRHHAVPTHLDQHAPNLRRQRRLVPREQHVEELRSRVLTRGQQPLPPDRPLPEVAREHLDCRRDRVRIADRRQLARVIQLGQARGHALQPRLPLRSGDGLDEPVRAHPRIHQGRKRGWIQLPIQQPLPNLLGNVPAIDEHIVHEIIQRRCVLGRLVLVHHRVAWGITPRRSGKRKPGNKNQRGNHPKIGGRALRHGELLVAKTDVVPATYPTSASAGLACCRSGSGRRLPCGPVP